MLDFNAQRHVCFSFFSLLHDVPEFELAAYLPVFNLDELIVAGSHAAVLHKPLEAKGQVVQYLKERHKQETAMRIRLVASRSSTTLHLSQRRLKLLNLLLVDISGFASSVCYRSRGKLLDVPC